MTGSPVTKNPLDLYSQCKFLSSWLLNFASYYSFRNRYALMKTIHVRGRSIQVVDKFQNLNELSDQLKELEENSNDEQNSESNTDKESVITASDNKTDDSSSVTV